MLQEVDHNKIKTFLFHIYNTAGWEFHKKQEMNLENASYYFK